MAELDIDSLNAMSADELAERLAGSPEERAAIVRTAAEADVAQAQALYGQMLLDGVGVAKDERAALAWFAKAANQNHILAINMVGRCYRSEEHTSELQSLMRISYAVFCLKKKKNHNISCNLN